MTKSWLAIYRLLIDRARSGLLLLGLGLIAALIIIALPIAAQDGGTPTGGQPWDLLNTTQPGLFVFYDTPTGASTTGKPLDIGDFDGNGCGDIAITGQNASHAIEGEWRGSSGHVRIVMNLCAIESQIIVDEVIAGTEGAVPEGQSVFSIYGARPGDMAGTETYVADFDGDGYDDLLFSAQNSDGPNEVRPNAGAAYVLFGGPEFAQHADVDLHQLSPEAHGDIIAFYGAAAEDRFGLWVEGGDFDGDGFHDLLIGANQADGENDARINAGEVWIIYGMEDWVSHYGQVTDMATPPDDATRIIGADYDDLLGSCAWGEDLNGDGYADAILSAGLWRASSGLGGLSFGGADGPANSRYNSGETFVLFGNEGLRGETVDLATRLNDQGGPIDDSLTVIYGPDANDLLGEEIAVGDMDGDGRYDLILGTLIGDGPENNMDEAGEVWVIYTHDPFVGQMIDLATPEPERAVVIYPDQPDSKAGDTLRAADINNDGIADLFYGAPDHDPTGYDGLVRQNAGILAVIFGQEGGLSHDNGRILLFDPPEGLQVRFIIGADANDMMPYALAVYDLDGDGTIDIAPNAMGGDGAYNDQTNAGEIYVISGAEFTYPFHQFTGLVAQGESGGPTPTPRPDRATVTPPPTTSALVAGDRERGEGYFNETCAGCHGPDGEGVDGLGLPLTTSPLVLNASDLGLLEFLQEGRSADHPDNVTGVSMPPNGGRVDWGAQELADVIDYMRWLSGQAQ